MFKNQKLKILKMILHIKNHGGYRLPETTLKNMAKTEVILIKRSLEILIKNINTIKYGRKRKI
ncbi:hypothetical protein AR438_03140 [Chryseobacterium aquaticum]|uniref:Uncharacterized protein n=1 Tax=Chryseobacterium aquaticum TaxID=452084 RepID=A0A0Q3HWI6_9FLAO|nr:hypothetical protein AR438_03140 [Chryseobacterium aquaticum]